MSTSPNPDAKTTTVEYVAGPYRRLTVDDVDIQRGGSAEVSADQLQRLQELGDTVELKTTKPKEGSSS